MFLSDDQCSNILSFLLGGWGGEFLPFLNGIPAMYSKTLTFPNAVAPAAMCVNLNWSWALINSGVRASGRKPLYVSWSATRIFVIPGTLESSSTTCRVKQKKPEWQCSQWFTYVQKKKKKEVKPVSMETQTQPRWFAYVVEILKCADKLPKTLNNQSKKLVFRLGDITCCMFCHTHGCRLEQV